MSLNELANLGQIIGAIAVVVSLFYVAHQIRQNTYAVRSATVQTVHEHFAKWYHLVAADAALSQIVANGLRDYASLSEQERVRFIAAFMAFPLLLPERISEMARRTAGVTSVEGLGACYHEPRMRAGWQGFLERP